MPVAVRCGYPDSVDAACDQVAELDWFALLVGVLVELGEPEHVVDERAHPLGFQADAAHDLVDLVAFGERALLVELGIGAHRRQRGAQFVAGVGEELAHQLLVGLAFVHGSLDARQHSV